MSDPVTPPVEPEVKPDPTPEPEAGAKPDENVETLPQWARDAITKANAEAANARVKARELAEALGKAKTPEEVEALLTEERAKTAALERAVLTGTVAAKHGLPPEFASRLAGSTPEEIEADAKALSALFKPAPTPSTPGGGLTPGSDPDPLGSDPRKLAGRRHR